MAYSIRWTQKANSDYLEVIDYLKINRGNRSADKFIDKVEKQIGLIQEMPNLYPATGFFKGLRRCVLVKQISMYYLEVEVNKEIIIIRLYDNRRDTSELEESIEEMDL